jgi:hypothetical protein
MLDSELLKGTYHICGTPAKFQMINKGVQSLLLENNDDECNNNNNNNVDKAAAVVATAIEYAIIDDLFILYNFELELNLIFIENFTFQTFYKICIY